MKKTLSWLVVVGMMVSILQSNRLAIPVEAAEYGTNATFIAARFVPIGFNRDGSLLDRSRIFPWQKGTGEEIFGRTGYAMPDSELATINAIFDKDALAEWTYRAEKINIPARGAQNLYQLDGVRLDTTIDTTVEPLFWNDFYLTVDPYGGKSQLYDHWYAVYDSAGQLWIDPDGYFHDCRYYEFADPTNLYGNYGKQFGAESDYAMDMAYLNKQNNCKNNMKSHVDPIASNNTQGPYILDPEHPMFNGELDEDGNVKIYFWDKNKTNRVFRIGWVDMLDFPLLRQDEQTILAPNIVQSGIKDGSAYSGTPDWDALARFPLVDFRYWGIPGSVNLSGVDPSQATYDLDPDLNYRWYYNSYAWDEDSRRANQGDELHTDHIGDANQKNPAQDPLDDGIDYYTQSSNYDPGEYIYRKGIDINNPDHNTLFYVQAGDMRLTPVSVVQSGTVKNYPAHSIVKETDFDCRFPADETDPINGTPLHSSVDSIYHALYRFVINFAAEDDPALGITAGDRVAKNNDEMHVDNIKQPDDFSWSPLWYSYEYKEWIYREGGDKAGLGIVSIGDSRLTNVNGYVNPATMQKDRKRGLINSDVQFVTSTLKSNTYVPRVYGDLLLLAEVLQGGCNEPLYNLSIETDVWEGPMPSVTSTNLRTPNKEFELAGQHVQKNTALDPTGQMFNIPATTYQDIRLAFREYIGVEIFQDDGFDNNIGINDTESERPLKDVLFAYNLSDDYKAGIRGETFIGANNDIQSDMDLGRTLAPMPDEVMYTDEFILPNRAGISMFVYGCQKGVYRNVNKELHSSGFYQCVNAGDIRLMDITLMVNNIVISYQKGTTVSPGDADVNAILFNFPNNFMFYDEEWAATKTPLNSMYDVDEDIYRLHDLYHETSSFSIYFGYLNQTDISLSSFKVVYADSDNSLTVSVGDIRIYDYSGTYLPNTVVKMTDSDCSIDNQFPQSHQVQMLALTHNTTATPREYECLYLDMDRSSMFNLTAPGTVEDKSNPSTLGITPGDLRLTNIFNYRPFSIVDQNDEDYLRYSLKSPASPDNWDYSSAHPANPRIWDSSNRNVIIADPENDDNPAVGYIFGWGDPANPDESVYDDDMIFYYRSSLYDTRYTDVTASGQFYHCGSQLGDIQNYWIDENPVHGLSVGKNGDFRFIDWEVFPTDDIGLNVNLSRNLKVEQTTQIEITVEPAPEKAHWEDDVYYPDERVYIYLKDTDGPQGLDIYEDYRVITPDNPIAVFQFTPYRGTCNADGFSHGWQKVSHVRPINDPDYQVENVYSLVNYDLRVEVVAFKESGGIARPAPLLKAIFDPYWKKHTNQTIQNKIDVFGDIDGNIGRYFGNAYGDNPWTPPAYPLYNPETSGCGTDNTPILPPEYIHTFDCYGQIKLDVAPEDLGFVSSKKCIGTLDQRFPNLSLKLKDGDNVNDVNDPFGMALSTINSSPNKQIEPAAKLPIKKLHSTETAAIYNAYGAGISYLFTGFMVSGLDSSVAKIYNNEYMKINDTHFDAYEFTEKVIVQVHMDGTFLYWHWADVGPHSGMLDPGDELWVPAPDTTFGQERLPGYIQSQLKPITDDFDCSEGTNECDLCGLNFRNKRIITPGDKFGPFVVTTYGVPTYLRNYGEPPRSATDQGGDILITVAPRDAATKLQLQVFTYNVIYDYNSEIKHPPYYILDGDPANYGYFDTDTTLIYTKNPISKWFGSGLRNFAVMGVDYCGIKEFKVLPPDPYVNFAEFSIVDHALQNSSINYTSGLGGLSPLPVPTPQIEAVYNPMVLDVGKDFRGYPGGQTHTGRLVGGVRSGGYTRSDENHNGWNAYPAIWWWFWYEDIEYQNFTDFNKLGTEYFPLTDYGFYFIIKDIDGNHLSFSETAPIDQRMRRLEITGPFAKPKVFDQLKNSIVSTYEYNATRQVPIVYDWTGKIIIDHANMADYEYQLGFDWTRKNGDWDITDPDNITNQYDTENSILRDLKQLDYRGLKNVFRFEEIIPIGAGKINFKVTLWDGTVKIFQDCCAEPPTDGVDVHALGITTDMNTLTADTDNKITATIKETEVMQQEQLCNDAYVYIWQDRGVINRSSNLYDGAGDGWVTNPPHSSAHTELRQQYLAEEDLNSDGKISFREYETEIMGTYDLATNTWIGGVIDARTFQRNNGEYVFDLSESNGSRINTVGLDFGGAQGVPDHVISDYERLPIMITAYKYGDDNNDRAFTPLYGFPGTTPQFSHEVYLSGQKFIEVTPLLDLSVSVQPNPLTAGVTPELVDPVSPLSFVLTNEEGNPVDLSRGVPDANGETYVNNDDIWNYLFDDIHPYPLPEYYWLRTDLHNNDNTRVNNRYLYSTSNSPFQPIAVDFSMAKDGKYAFRGFCANDEGSFDVYIYTPDRKHAAKATVNVVLPTAEWAITNTEDPAGTEFQVPGEPDFVLTAADCRIYRIRVTAKNAQGLLLKGVTKGVSTCGGGIKNTARFTPYSTRPASFDFTEKDRYLFAEHFLQDLYPYTLNIGFDFNDNQKIDVRNSELYPMGTFTHTMNRDGQKTLGQIYYNTTLFRFDEDSIHGGWDVEPNPNLVPPMTGWGLGAIYNSAHRGGYLFADVDPNQRLDYHDSLGLDVNAETTFYIFAEDLAYIGGLIGDNVYCNNPSQADLAGYPPAFKTDPATIYARFDPDITPDGVFFLDWEAFPAKEIEIMPPQLLVLEGKTRAELSKNYLNSANYDLTYALETHMIVQVRPADHRDMPMKENGRVFMIGNQHQTAIYGNTKQSASDPKVMETTLHFTPTGLGENVAYMGYFNKSCHYLVPPYDLKNTSTYTLRNLLEFDSVTGLQLEVYAEDVLHPNKTSAIQAKVTDIGTNAPVEGATVTLKGPGVNATAKTNKEGVANFTVTPNDKGIIEVVATVDGKHVGTAQIRVVPDAADAVPWLEVDPLPLMTNKPQTEVSGLTNPGNTVMINNQTVQVDTNGAFKGMVALKEGLNTIIVEAKNKNDMKVRKMVTITLDTTPPNVFIDDPGYLVTIGRQASIDVEITGRVEPGSTVTVNNIPAKVTHDIFKTEATKVALKPGKNTLTVVAVDEVGNGATVTKEILVYRRMTIQLIIDNAEPIIDDEKQPPLEAAPFISGGRTMVPVRFIAEAYGADVQYDQTTKGITITLDDTVIAMQVGVKTAYVNGKAVLIDASPVIVNGRTFVPIRFISESFHATVSYQEATRTVTIVRDFLPK